MDATLEKAYQEAIIEEYEKSTHRHHSTLSSKQHAIEKEFLAGVEKLFWKMSRDDDDPELTERVRCYILGLRDVCYHLSFKDGGKEI
jgi:hypothetical protein